MVLELIAAGVVLQEASLVASEMKERKTVFRQARAYADSVGKPLLVVGVPKGPAFHRKGDVTIDLDPILCALFGAQVSDVRAIPYPDGYFGAAFISHVLEHLPTVADAEQAVRELSRVAQKTFIVSPHRSSLIACLHPEHKLWVYQQDGRVMFEQR